MVISVTRGGSKVFKNIGDLNNWNKIYWGKERSLMSLLENLCCLHNVCDKPKRRGYPLQVVYFCLFNARSADRSQTTFTLMGLLTTTTYNCCLLTWSTCLSWVHNVSFLVTDVQTNLKDGGISFHLGQIGNDMQDKQIVFKQMVLMHASWSILNRETGSNTFQFHSIVGKG